jgi:hypothetical protein
MVTSLLDSAGAPTRAGRFRPLAERALADERLSRDEALAVLEGDDDAATSLFVEGYLTTPGQGRDEALATITGLGFEVESGLDPRPASVTA